MGVTGLTADLSKLPPVQIHHGEADRVVPPEQSRELVRELERLGRICGVDFEGHLYAGEGRGFTDPTAIKNSRSRTAAFFAKHL